MYIQINHIHILEHTSGSCLYVSVYVCMYAFMHACMHVCIYIYIYIHIYIYIYIYAHRTGRLPGACVFSHETALLFHGPPRSLRRVVAENYCETSHEANFVSYAWRGATPSVRSIPARRCEPRMKYVICVKTVGKMKYIMSSWANVRFCGCIYIIYIYYYSSSAFILSLASYIPSLYQ